jgi:hypothetical protein
MKDHTKERAMKDSIKREKIISTMKKSNRELRPDLTDYYAANEDLINKTSQIDPSDQDKLFNNMKILNKTILKGFKNSNKSDVNIRKGPLKSELQASVDRLSKPKIK